MMINELCRDPELPRSTPDSELFQAIFDYIESYAKMHYPKEERYLFSALRLRDPESHALLDHLEQEHAYGSKSMARLRDLLAASQEGLPATRLSFVETLGEFAQKLDAHMDEEERQVFPRALEHLSEQDWGLVNEGYLNYDALLDPLLSEAASSQFGKLYSRIILYAPEPLGGLGLQHSSGSAAPPATDQMLGMEGGIDSRYGHIRALDRLTETDWQAINEQYLHFDDPRFGEIVKDELRQLHTRIAYYAPPPIGLGMERIHATQVQETPDRVLEIRGLTSHYGRIQALNEVDLEINKGELVALVGSNGAGKTTLLRTIAGLQPASGGSLKFADREITTLRADRRVKLGIALIPEGRQIFGPLSVEDNLLLGAYTRPKDDQIGTDLDQMYRLFPILRQKRKQAAGTLSGGQQQMLAMARALMARPQLLLLDEPSMGLAPILVEEIFNTVGELKRRGITIFLVEQNAAAALSIADRGYVIETGTIVLSGPGRKLLQNDKVKEAYLGGT